MRIAYLLGSLNTGGTEKLLLDVFRAAPNNGLNCIGIYRKGGQLEEDFLCSGIPLYKVQTNGKNLFSYLFRLRKLLISERIDIAHAQQAIDALLIWFASIGLHIKVIITLHGFSFVGSNISVFLRVLSLLLSDKGIFVSRSQQTDYLVKFPILKRKNTCVIYNGISFDKFKSSDTSNIREEFGIGPNTYIFGSVGNFNSVRNQFLICRVLKQLKEQNIDFFFLFIGCREPNETQLFDNCVDYCKANNLNNVVFTGFRNDVPTLLKQLDAFIYASNLDTFGIAVVEAIAAGIPVFVNDWKVMLEVSENGKFANLYSSEIELLDLLIDFVSDNLKYKKFASEASDKVIQKYSIEQHIKLLNSVYL